MPEAMPPSYHGPPGMPPLGYGPPLGVGYPHGPPPYPPGPGYVPPPGYGPSLGLPPGMWPPGAPPPHSAPGVPLLPGRPLGPPKLLDPIAAFVAENNIDSLAEETLRALSPDFQHRVLSEGAVTGHNTSAVLMGRIRAVEQAASRRTDGDRGLPAVNTANVGQPLPLQNNSPQHLAPLPNSGEVLAVGAKLLPRAPAGPQALGCAWGDPVGSSWGDPVPRRDDAGQQPPLPNTSNTKTRPTNNGNGGGSNEDRISWFCRQSSVDASAERVLRQLHPDAQRRVMEEGPVGGSNPSLELVARIHRIEAWEHNLHVSAFLSRNFVDTVTEESFRALSIERQRLVIGYGPLLGADASAELLSRMREVSGHEGRGVPDGDSIGQFASQNAIDASAEAALRSLPPELQQCVLLEGPVRGTKNPSAVLMSRIRRVRSSGDADHKPQMSAFADTMQGPPSMSPPHASHTPPGGTSGHGNEERDQSGSIAHSSPSESHLGIRSKSPHRDTVGSTPAACDDKASIAGQGTRGISPPDFADQLAGFARSGGMSY